MSDFPTDLFINGELRPSKSRKTIPQINPATEEQFCAVAAATIEDLQEAVQGANRAFLSQWRDLTPRSAPICCSLWPL